jgi:hypothetical protein
MKDRNLFTQRVVQQATRFGYTLQVHCLHYFYDMAFGILVLCILLSYSSVLLIIYSCKNFTLKLVENTCNWKG